MKHLIVPMSKKQFKWAKKVKLIWTIFFAHLNYFACSFELFFFAHLNYFFAHSSNFLAHFELFLLKVSMNKLVQKLTECYRLNY